MRVPQPGSAGDAAQPLNPNLLFESKAHRPMGAHLLASQAFSSSFRRGASVS